MIFDWVEWKNLLSTGNAWTRVELGSNMATLIIGKNGGGKSQLIDAIFFALFGKPYRSINKSALINSRNGKGLEVKLQFTIGPNVYMIHRGMKPTIFNIYCNGKLINQDAMMKDYQQLLEDTVLHFNHKSASQVIILGSAKFIPFMQLKAVERRAVVEDVLDIKVFTLMNQKLKDRVTKLKNDWENNAKEINRLVETEKLLQDILAKETANIQNDIFAKEHEIHILTSEIDRLNGVNHALETENGVNGLLVKDHEKLLKKKTDFGALESAFQTKLKKLDSELWFFEENETCPTCLQDIGADHKDHMHKEREERRAKLQAGLDELIKDFQETEKTLVTMNETLRTILENTNKIRQNNVAIVAYDDHRSRIRAEIVQLKTKLVVPNDTGTKLDEIRKNLAVLQAKRDEYLALADTYEEAGKLLKDGGIKTQIIKQYLPVINQAINKFLQMLGFHHSFELDEEFNETIKSHFIDEFSYENFSEGEKQRIDLALLLSWRHVAKIKGSIKTNLLVMDETFDSSMDDAGVEDLMKLFMTNFGKDVNLFVISHRGDTMLEKFDKILKFEKIKGYSIMKEEK